MNYYELGAGLVLGASITAAIIYLYIRLARVESQLIQARQENADNEIIKNNSKLSDGELDGLLGDSLGRPPKT